ncbi:TonB-dependent receptor [Fulvivirgaceae bacterium BMA10]|uniref:TonB-dependent receptor n=2 Tax=Splendidivirga corallicola TaxID=3051826 RepID=A0ABT8KPY6_9BACT|nr:TonB-dependent receptor [Fulvivirgaceae bacterium BMA10]
MRIFVLTSLFIVFTLSAMAQNAIIRGMVSDSVEVIPFASVFIKGTTIGTTTDANGEFTLRNIPKGDYVLVASFVSYTSIQKNISVKENSDITVNFALKPNQTRLDEVVVTGTMKPISRLESPVPVEVYTPTFFKANPTPSVYEAMSNVNGVRPQVNCSVCNTGDIHINGLEGAYTMVTIDGMPIVSGLSTVYGLSGIPQSLIERVEIVKGPASTLYGSESVGGLINVITKKPNNAPLFTGDVFTTSWGEINTDIASKFNLGKKAEALVGVNYFNFNQRIDNNNDNFTDVTLQDRISVFNKWNFKRKGNRVFSLAGRYVYEDRFGGDLGWATENRGGDDIYGESIYTNRWEIFGTYQLPVKERVMFMFSANEHDQNSVYGDTWYIADQKIAFGQLTWNKEVGKRHDFLFGAAMRYTYYDDNTPATASSDIDNPSNQPSHTYLPGLFVQDEIVLDDYNKLLLGMRYDYNSLHGNIFTPRFNYKWNSKNKQNILRFSFGTGYRVANVFTEDHAALTGAREVVFLSDLKPETSFNVNINYVKKIYTRNDWFIGIDGAVFYTYFNNKIFPDYDTDPNKIIYDNLSGHAVSNGVSVNLEVVYKDLSILAGVTAMDVFSVQDGVRERQELTEQFTGTWSIGYVFPKIGLSLDYTGNLYGPMALPLLGDDDPRPEFSPWWSIQNIQITKAFGDHLELYGGVKNLLNWVPWRNLGDAGLITRTNDPFDKNVVFDTNGEVVATPNNPYAFTFDPTYVYGPNQGIRGFFGLRYTFDQ